MSMGMDKIISLYGKIGTREALLDRISDATVVIGNSRHSIQRATGAINK